MTAPVVAGMTASIRHLDGYSATETLGCLRKVRLEKEYDYWLKPSELYWAFRGQLMHAIAETRYAATVFLDTDPIKSPYICPQSRRAPAESRPIVDCSSSLPRWPLPISDLSIS